VSRLLVVTRPDLAPGFRLAGVDAFGAQDAESAQELITPWLEGEEVNLLAIDDGLYALMAPGFIEQLEACEHLPHLVIPGGRALGEEATRRYRVAEIIRRAIGFHITFKGEKEK
jgi:V/A-type H+-transporting ATPase subunit F